MEILNLNIVSVEMDRDAAVAESTLSNSFESGLTVESSVDSKLDECVAWTNEKHNSYLDYLENSFVRQLYSLLGRETQGPSRTRDVLSNSRKSTDQFKVIQNVCWQKVDFGKKRARLESSIQRKSSSNNLAIPNEDCTVGTSVQGKALCCDEAKHSGDKTCARTSSMRNFVGHAYPAQTTAEASGQNFNEEEDNECNSEVTRKRKRGASFDDSSLNDQVVP